MIAMTTESRQRKITQAALIILSWVLAYRGGSFAIVSAASLLQAVPLKSVVWAQDNASTSFGLTVASVAALLGARSLGPVRPLFWIPAGVAVLGTCSFWLWMFATLRD